MATAPPAAAAAAPVGRAKGGPMWATAWRYHLMNSPTYVPQGASERERREFGFCVPTGRFCEMFDLFGEKYHSSFDVFGSGVTSFFKFEKWLAWMWAILTVFAFPGIIINTFGPGNGETAPASGLAGTTLRNMYSTKVNDTLVLPTGTEVDSVFAALVYTGCDFLGSLLFLVGYLYMRFMLKEEEKNVDRSIISASDYSVYVPMVPSDLSEEDLEGWVESVANKIRADKLKAAKKINAELQYKPPLFRVVDINIVENNSGILGLMEKRALLLSSLHRVEAKLALFRAGKITFADECMGCFAANELRSDRRRLQRRIKTVVDRIVAIKVARAKKAGSVQQAVAAFVTFESAQDKDDFVAEYPEGATSLLCQPKSLFLKGKQVQVYPAPEPSAVMWTNLHVTDSDQFMRLRVSDFFSAWVIAFSFIIIFFASWQSDKYNGVLDLQACKERETASWMARYDTFHTQDEEYEYQNMTSGSSNKLFCLCELQQWEALDTIAKVEASPWRKACVPQYCNRLFIVDADYVYNSAPACKDWTLVKTNAIIFTVGASVIVLVINQSLGIILRYLADWEGHHSVEFRDTSVAIRLFFAQFFNTAVLMILVNIAWPELSYDGSRYKIGQYADITSGWYDNVGSSLMTTMIINWVSPHTYYTVSGLFLRMHMERKKKDVGSSMSTQDDVNASFVGLPMDLALRHAQLLNVAFVTFVFSTGMPLLIPIGAVSFFLTYWVDKCLFVRYYSRPPTTTNRITLTMSGLLPLALLLHLAFGVWMLGSIGTFNKALKAYSPVNYEAYLEPLIGDPAALQRTAVAGVPALGGVVLEAVVFDPATNLTTPYKFFVDGYGGFNDTATLGEYFFNVTAPPDIVDVPAYDRIFSPSAIPLFALFTLTLVGYVLSFVLRLLGSAAVGFVNVVTCGICKKQVSAVCSPAQHADDAPPFTVAVSGRVRGSKMALQGTPTYNILGQPDLQRKLHINPKLAALSNSLMDAVFTDEAEVGNIVALAEQEAAAAAENAAAAAAAEAAEEAYYSGQQQQEEEEEGLGPEGEGEEYGDAEGVEYAEEGYAEGEGGDGGGGQGSAAAGTGAAR